MKGVLYFRCHMSPCRAVRRSAATRSGTTLVELMVGFTLTVLLFGLMFQFLIPALKISARTTERAETQQQAVLALRNLVREIETTSVLGVSLSADRSTVVIHPVATVTQHNDRVYADRLVVYRFESEKNQILRYEWKGEDDPPIDTPRKLSIEEMAELETRFVGEGRVLVKGVESFAFSHSGTGELLAQPFTAHLRMQKRPGDGSREFEMIQAISLRNQI